MRRWFNDIHETEKRLESGQFAKDQEQKKTVIDIPQPAKESIPVTPCGDSLHQASCEARPKFEVDFSAPIPEDF